MQKMFEDHGVQKEQSHDRMMAFVTKCDIETVAKSMQADDNEFWKAMKAEANRVKFRLIYRPEMQVAKKGARAKPPSKPEKSHGKARNDFVATATNIKIDVANFVAAGEQVSLLDSGRFGQDQTGLAIMNLAEANKVARDQCLSMDALAVLVVSSKFNAEDEPFLMPAFKQDGSPIVVKAALRQYGEVPVEFRANMPALKVTKTASTVVELHIIRKEVSDWKDCAIPLHYLGIHISAVRGDNLISTWALKAWNDDKKVVPVKSATYWHGYFRVKDEILEQIISRSGYAGIYVSPKSDTKRHDERYAVVVVPNTSLADVQKRASTIEKAMGIVKVRDQFAIRCRREHVGLLRMTLLPESAFVATDASAHDESIWVLKNVPIQVGREGIDQALQQAEWQAHVIKAQGHDRWIVAAKMPPPCLHLSLNNQYVLIEPLRKTQEVPAVTVVAKQFKVDTMVTNEGATYTSSRFQEVKTELSENFEMKLQAANTKIEQLAVMLNQVHEQQAQAQLQNKADLEQLREEQSFAKQKIQEIEGSVTQSGQQIIQQMSGMMQQMQASLEASMKAMLPASDDAKRRCTEDPPRGDAFAAKS